MEELKILNLSDNEIQVYIALLELGSSKVDGLTKRVALPRTTIYGLLKSLLEKGMVSYVIKGSIKYFIAVEPKHLISMQKEKVETLRKIVPELEKIKGTIGDKPSIEMFEGPKGIKSMYDEIIREGKDILGYGNTALFYRSFGSFVENFILNRKETKLNFLLITENSAESDMLRARDKQDKRKTLQSELLNDMKTVNYIYGDNIAIMTMIKKEHIGVIIKNKEIADSHRIIFDAFRRLAK